MVTCNFLTVKILDFKIRISASQFYYSGVTYFINLQCFIAQITVPQGLQTLLIIVNKLLATCTQISYKLSHRFSTTRYRFTPQCFT